MVSLVKLSSSNMDDFKQLHEMNFNKDTYDKDFFEYYNSRTFLPKVFLKKSVKVFTYKNKIIGYIWYEVSCNKYVRVFSLYINDTYINLIDNETIKKFNEKHLIYEAMDSDYMNNLMIKLGFKNSKPSKLMQLTLLMYKNECEINKLAFRVSNNKKILSLINTTFNVKYRSLDINFKKVDIDYDIMLRCEIQNRIFENDCRIPIEVEDVEYDIKQEYYIEDLAIFLKINNIVVGYGQIIYTRKRFTLVNFGVIDILRNYGLGKILLNHMIKEAREMNIENLTLRVDNQNYNAISLYKGIGFEEVCNILRWER